MVYYEDNKTDALRQSSLPIHLSIPKYSQDRRFSRTSSQLGCINLPRPIPPTPSRMAATSQVKELDFDFYVPSSYLRSRPVSISAIPRPVSDTSRRMTPSRLPTSIHNDKDAKPEVPLLSPLRIRRPLQTPHTLRKFDNAQCSISSSSLYGSSPTSKTSKLHRKPVNQEKSFHKSTASSPVSFYSSSFRAPTDDLAQPSTSSYVTSPKREITPRRLMQPIHPPLPRSQTLGNMPCFSGQTASSTIKSPRYISFSRRFDRKNTVEPTSTGTVTGQSTPGMRPRSRDWDKLDVEVRQTECAAICRLPSCAVYGVDADDRWNKEKSKPRTENTIGEEKDPLAATCIGKYKRRPFGSGQLLVNTALANSLKEKVSSAFSSPKSTISNLTQSPESASNHDFKNVYTVEDSSYWVGRYIATCDRIRQADCTLLIDGDENTRPMTVNSTIFEKSYDGLEITRQRRALQELNALCMTKASIKSFARFERQLLQGIAPKSASDSSISDSENFEKEDFVNRASMLCNRYKQDDIDNFRQPYGSCASSTSSVTAINAQATFSRLSNLVGRTGLVKSKTTANLTTLPAQTSVKLPSRIDPEAYRTVNPIKKSHTRKSSNLSNAFNMPEKSCGATDTQELCRKASSSRRENGPYSGPTSVVFASTKSYTTFQPLPSNTQTIEKTKTITQSPKTGHHTSGTVTSDYLTEITASALLHRRDNESGRCPIETMNFSSTGKSRTRTLRSGSGELIKKMVGASAREVRKMGRRVGSMGWGTSHEDLNLP